MSKLPYMPVFFGDFLASTAGWDGEEQSLYLLLLCYQWASGPLPPDTKRLCRLTRFDPKLFARLWKTVGEKFIETEQGLINPRLEEHRTKAGSITDKRKSAGKNGAAAKWGETSGKTRAERLAVARQLATHSKEEWSALIKVCGDACVRCGIHAAELNGGVLCKDHITPIYQGGSDGIENIQPMCRECNSSKGPDCTDHRPNDWRERLAKRLADARQDACNPIQSNPNIGVRGLPRRGYEVS